MAVTSEDHRRRGRRLVLRYAALQLVATLAAALVGLAAGAATARAVLAGGAIVAVGSAAFGWRLFAPGVAPVRALARAAYAGEVLKWLWVIAALALAIGPGHLPGLPLVAGMLAAQIGFWVGLAVIR